MQERRRHPRFARRLVVQFGEAEALEHGYSSDLSEGGMFVFSQVLPPVQTRLHLKVAVAADRYVAFEGVVVRHKAMPAERRGPAWAAGGFSVRFLRPEELLEELAAQDAAMSVRQGSGLDMRASGSQVR